MHLAICLALIQGSVLYVGSLNASEVFNYGLNQIFCIYLCSLLFVIITLLLKFFIGHKKFQCRSHSHFCMYSRTSIIQTRRDLSKKSG